MFNLCTRRSALRLIGSGAVLLWAGCRTDYERPYGELDLGELGGLLYDKQFIRDKAMLVFRDAQGWSALSTRCTHEGCELSFQESILLCMCCSSTFDHGGKVLKGPATKPLPWFKLSFSNDHLYAIAGEKVEPSYRFTTPEIELALEKLRERIQEEGARTGARIPDILLGRGDGESGGPIFRNEKSESAVTTSSTTSTTLADVLLSE